MAAYYNEFDAKKAAWLRELIRRGLIADGVVDERSIEDVTPADLAGFRQCHFFAGIGIWSYALRLASIPDDEDVWSASCPCQPFSAIGERAGFADERHLWPDFFWLVSQCRPRRIYGEQVASAGGLAWLDSVRSDLEGEGYAIGVSDLSGPLFGAPHIRSRLYFGAQRMDHTDRTRPQGYAGDGGQAGRWQGSQRSVATASVSGDRSTADSFWSNADWIECEDGKWRPIQPGAEPVVNGPAARILRCSGYGDGIIAQVAQNFIEAFDGACAEIFYP